MIKIRYGASYHHDLLQLLSMNPELESQINKRIIWFVKKPADNRLRNHPLKGELSGKWAFSITDDVRVIYIWLSKNQVRFLAIGGHQSVYEGHLK